MLTWLWNTAFLREGVRAVLTIVSLKSVISAGAAGIGAGAIGYTYKVDTA